MNPRFLLAGMGPVGIAILMKLLEYVSPKDILVVDPLPPFEQFRHKARNIHMQDMRSNWANSAVKGGRIALQQFGSSLDASTQTSTPSMMLASGYGRMLTELSGVQQIFASVTGVQRCNDHWQVKFSNGKYCCTPNVIFNLGLHVHQRDPLANTIPVPKMCVTSTDGKAAVLGTGMTAAHAALYLLKNGAGSVTMYSGSGLKVASNEASSQWTNRKTGDGCTVVYRDDVLHAFQGKTPEQRVAQMRRDSQGGTVDPGLYEKLQPYLDDGRLVVKHKRVGEVSVQSGGFRISVPNGLMTDHNCDLKTVYDARGFAPHVDNLSCIQGLRELIGDDHYNGLPLLDRYLQIRNGLLLTGPMATMTLGPPAPTILGGQLAATAVGNGLEKGVYK